MARPSSRHILACLVVGAAVVTAPFLWRGVLAAWGPRDTAFVPSYLPALEASRERAPFDPVPIGDLTSMAPGYVVIGDSMAGRIDPEHLTALSGEAVAPILQNATGSGYWYLVFKNYVVLSGIRPRRVFVFFRDTNLTDVLFRIDGAYRAGLDPVARDREDDLNRVVAARTARSWYGAHAWVDRLYGIERARSWIEPRLNAWPARVVGGPDGRETVLTRANAMFGLEHMRTTRQVDLADAEDEALDFAGTVERSALPLFLSLAREHGLGLCFVRVLRRPENGQPPPESPAVARYVTDLRAYLTRGGAVFIDDRDDPALAALGYADGDHIARDARVPYTDRFWQKVQQLGP